MLGSGRKILLHAGKSHTNPITETNPNPNRNPNPLLTLLNCGAVGLHAKGLYALPVITARIYRP